MKILISLLTLCLVTAAFAKTSGPIQWETVESKKNKTAPNGLYQFDFSFWSSEGPATYEVALRTLPNSVLEIVSKRSLSFKKTAADKKMTFPVQVRLNQDSPLQNLLVIDVTQHHEGGRSGQTIPIKLPLVPPPAPEKLMQKAK